MAEQANKLELHYYFRDNSHSMDAFIRNQCEKELLYIYKEVLSLFDIDAEVESEAFDEGGFKGGLEIYRKKFKSNYNFDRFDRYLSS